MRRMHLAAYYMAVFLGLGAVLPFLPLVLQSRGMSARSVGLVLVIGPCANLIAPPLWAWLADTFGVRGRLMSLAPLGCAVGVSLLIIEGGMTSAVIAMVTYAICRGPIVPMADATTHAVLGDDAPRFARIRVWGSIGFVCAAVGFGSLDASHHVGVLFGMSALAYVAASAIASRFATAWQPRRSGVAMDALRDVRDKKLGGLLVGGAFYYFAHGSYDAFIGLHLRALGYGDHIVGYAWAVAVCVEIALMLVVRPVIQRFPGVWLLMLGGIVSVVRWTLLSWVTSIPAILAVQSLHAITFGLWYLAMVGYVQSRASDALRTSVQALAHTTMALGMIAGYTVGAELFERAGGTLLFRAGAVAAVGATLSYATLLRHRPATQS